MRVRLLAFASVADLLGASTLDVDLADGARLSDLRAELVRRAPGLVARWATLAVAQGGEVLPRGGDPALHDGAEIALLPPVSGGAPEDDADVEGVLVDGPIDVARVEARVASPGAGARVVFLGTARDHHRGRPVEGLFYDAYRPLAAAALRRIARELAASADAVRLEIVHRLGEVAVGEPSVVIAVSSPHRGPAFELCRLALERLKREAPIWKRERYRDGEAEWREEEALEAPPGVAALVPGGDA